MKRKEKKRNKRDAECEVRDNESKDDRKQYNTVQGQKQWFVCMC